MFLKQAAWNSILSAFGSPTRIIHAGAFFQRMGVFKSSPTKIDTDSGIAFISQEPTITFHLDDKTKTIKEGYEIEVEERKFVVKSVFQNPSEEWVSCDLKSAS